MTFLEVKDISKRYDGHVALDHVSLTLEQGSIHGLLGPNGAGKTTLIRIINRIKAPDSGEVLLEGRPMTDADVRHIGYLPEERGLYKKMKVGDQIVYLARLHGMEKHDARTAMQEWLERFDLAAWRDKKVEQLSKGMAQKVQFIASVIHRPKLLIFDEPFSGFDPVNAELLKAEILRLRGEGASILYSTHNMASVEDVCRRISLINHAQVVLEGEVGEVRQRFRKHIYRLSVRGAGLSTADVAALPLDVEDEALRPDGGLDLTIRLHADASVREVIAALNERYELTSFQEVLPTMHEIFIETVKERVGEEMP